MKRAAGALLAALVFTIPLSIAAIETLFVILLLVWLIGWQPYRGLPARFRTPGGPAQGWLLAFVAVSALSIFYSDFRVQSIEGFIGKTVEYSLLFLIAADILSREKKPERALWAIVAAACVVVLWALFQEWLLYKDTYKVLVKDPITGHLLDYSRMVGPYKNPNDLATYLMVAGLIVIALLVSPVPNLAARAGYFLLAALLTGCLIWVQSKGALLGFCAGLLLLIYLYRRRRAAAVLAGITLASLAVFLFLGWDHLKEILTLSDVASKDRSIMWSTGWAMVKAKPLLGHGINTFMANYSSYVPGPVQGGPAYAHNCFLQMAAETGLAGLGIFFGFLAALTVLIRRGLRDPQGPHQISWVFLSGLVPALVAFLIQSAFDTNLYALRQAVLFWTLAGVAAGIAAQRVASSACAEKSC